MDADMSVLNSQNPLLLLEKRVGGIIFDNGESLLFIIILLIYNNIMPTYTTVDNVLDLYPRVGSLSTVSSSSIAFFITQAEAEINGHLINNYTLPFPNGAPIIETLATEYSLVKILERFFTQEVGSQNAWVSGRKEAVMDYLTKINSGDIGIVDNSLAIITYNAGDTIHSNTMEYNPTFTMLNSTLQQIDSDRLDDELDAVELEEYNPALY
jgi:phage gp36-like protein